MTDSNPTNNDLPTREEIAESQRVCEAATEGPWQSTDYTDLPEGSRGVALDEYEAFLINPGYASNEDCDFVAHARTALPRLNAAYLVLLAENEWLRNPSPGDGDMQSQQAVAWIAVWQELERAGVYRFVASDMRGRTRAVEFIRHLGSEVSRLTSALERGGE